MNKSKRMKGGRRNNKSKRMKGGRRNNKSKRMNSRRRNNKSKRMKGGSGFSALTKEGKDALCDAWKYAKDVKAELDAGLAADFPQQSDWRDQQRDWWMTRNLGGGRN